MSAIPKKPLIIAHRGASDEAPENTLPAIQRGLELDIFGVEFDVDLTQDGKVIAVHQETFRPNWESKQLELSKSDMGRLWTVESPIEKLHQLDAGAWFGKEFQNTKLPLLSEIFSLNWGEKVAVMEIKDNRYWVKPYDSRHAQALCEAICPIAEDFVRGGGKLCVLAFSHTVLDLMFKKLPHIPRILAVWTNENGRKKEVVDYAASIMAHAITYADFMILDDEAWVKCTKEKGIDVYVYEITPDTIEGQKNRHAETAEKRWEELARRGVDAIGTDFPRTLAKWMSRQI